jgi:hypothetical protein
MGNVNVEQLNLDCLLMLVQDVPHLNIALPSLETCHILVEFLKSNCNEPGIKSLESVLGLPEASSNGEEPIAVGKGHKSVYETLKKYRLDNLVERKLSPRFAEKYPFLDLTNSGFIHLALIRDDEGLTLCSNHELSCCQFLWRYAGPGRRPR